MSHDPSILVVGAGPCGLTMASELHRHGVPCRLIDAAPTAHAQSRATDIHARTLEVMDIMGVLEPFLERGVDRYMMTMHNDHELFLEIDLRDADTPHPTMLGIAQNDSEAILLEHLQELGGELERGIRLVGLRQDGEQVEVELEHQDGRRSAERYDWVIGCDGASSGVRKALDLSFEGTTYEELFYLADLRFADGHCPSHIAEVHTSADGLAMILPLDDDGLVRIFGDFESDPDAELSEEDCLEIVARRTGRDPESVIDNEWSNLFRVHSRMVDNYRHGRILLAGDAAHIHSPVGAHGMNTSMQDAFNLAWKLAWVARGWSPDELLDSYDEERRPIARGVLRETDLNTNMMMSRNHLMRQVIGGFARHGFKISALRRQVIAQTLELTVAYKPNRWLQQFRQSVLQAQVLKSPENESPCVQQFREFQAGPNPGERFPDLEIPGQGQRLLQWLARPSSTLLLFDGEADTEAGNARLARIAREAHERFGDRLQIAAFTPHDLDPESPLTQSGATIWADPDMVAHQRYGAQAECLYFLRPDGYVGYRSQPAAHKPLFSYLETLWPG